MIAKIILLTIASSVLLIAINLASAEVVNFMKCPPKEGVNYACEINEVRVDPCKEAPAGAPCKLKRGKSAQIAFDFTPQFDSDSLESVAYWTTVVDLEFPGMDKNACNYTTCPIVKDSKQTYLYALKISKKYPVGPFDVKWRTFTPDKKNECCFIVKIKIIP